MDIRSILKQVEEEWSNKTVPFPINDPEPFDENGNMVLNKEGKPIATLKGQCVQFIRWMLVEKMGLPNWQPVKDAKAANFWTQYESDPAMYKHWDKLPNTPSFLPKEGDICIWNTNKGGGYGHIAMVFEDRHTLNWFYSIESNWKPLRVSVVQHSYDDVIGFFRLKGE